MNTTEKQSYICGGSRSVRWSVHALGRLASMPETVVEIELALRYASVIEDYPHTHRYLPDCLVLTFTDDAEPIHCVVAIDEEFEYILIVTVYKPNKQEWNDDWKTRRT